MPVGDWQFWVVTAFALGAAWLVIKPFLPKRRKGPGKRVNLTIEGKRKG